MNTETQREFALDATIGNMLNADLASKYKVTSNTIRNWKKKKWYNNLMIDFHTAIEEHPDYLRVLVELNNLKNQINSLKG